MKRVYREVATRAEGLSFGVTLDNRPLRTPAKRDLLVPTAGLAAAIAVEWDAQHPDIVPAKMPLTRLAATALDRTAHQRDEIVAETANYAGTDLVCYRADHPPALAARQHETWQPLLDWAEGRYGARLEVTAGIMPKTQKMAVLNTFAAAVAAYDDFRLTGLHTATAACGSLVIALALMEGRLDADSAFAVSQLDESFQIEQWGEDSEAAARRSALAADIASTARFIALLKP